MALSVVARLVRVGLIPERFARISCHIRDLLGSLGITFIWNFEVHRLA